jgi:hypothetical protein
MIEHSSSHGNHSCNYAHNYDIVHENSNIVNGPILAEYHFDQAEVLEEKKD